MIQFPSCYTNNGTWSIHGIETCTYGMNDSTRVCVGILKKDFTRSSMINMFYTNCKSKSQTGFSHK